MSITNVRAVLKTKAGRFLRKKCSHKMFSHNVLTSSQFPTCPVSTAHPALTPLLKGVGSQSSSLTRTTTVLLGSIRALLQTTLSRLTLSCRSSYGFLSYPCPLETRGHGHLAPSTWQTPLARSSGTRLQVVYRLVDTQSVGNIVMSDIGGEIGLLRSVTDVFSSGNCVM